MLFRRRTPGLAYRVRRRSPRECQRPMPPPQHRILFSLPSPLKGLYGPGMHHRGKSVRVRTRTPSSNDRSRIGTRGLWHINGHQAQVAPELSMLGRGGRHVPCVMSRNTEPMKDGARDQVPLDIEDIVDRGVSGDKTLG